MNVTLITLKLDCASRWSCPVCARSENLEAQSMLLFKRHRVLIKEKALSVK